jgi:hypothetical protein
MRLLLPKRYSIEDATFSRASIAYDESQKLAGIGIPRIIKTAYGKMVMIEELQTNLFPVAYSRQFTSNWTSGTLNGTYTVKIYGSVGSLDLSGGYTGSVAAGETLTFDVSSATVTFTPTDDPVYCSLVLKSYITSWAESVRAAESLTMPVLATNLLTANLASVETDTTGFGRNAGTETLIRDTTEYKYGSASLKVITPGNAASEGTFTSLITVLASTYTASTELKGSGTVKLALYEPGVGFTYSDVITLSDVWTRYSVTRTFSTTSARIYITTPTAQAITFYADGLQLELGPYATTWNLPTSALVPRMGLPVEHGTIEGIVEITDVTKRTNAYSYLFHLVCPAGFVVFRHSISANWQINFADGISEYSGIMADSLTPNGLYYYKFYWDIGENKVVLEIWSLSARTKAGNIIVTPNYFPTLFGDVIYIGRYISGLHSNTRFGRHCLSDIARTDDPDFNDLMPVDANTVGIFDPTYTFLT